MTDFNQKTHDTDVGSHGGKSRQMMEVFENQEFGSIRLLQEAGKTFFCASDVAKALGYVNPYAAVKRHCRGPLTKREGVVQKMNQYGDAGEQVVEISFITEGDVYRLIVHSKLPSAERFEHWVFDEVLPSIRKHGVYMSDSILDQVIQHNTFRRSSPTVKEYCEKWLLLQSAQVRATTLTDYTSKVNRHIIKPLGHMNIADVTADDIRLALVPVSKKSASVYKSVNILYKSIFAAAKESKVIQDNPTIYLSGKNGGVPQKEKTPLTDDQVERLLDAIRGLPPYVFVMLGLYAGLRREEILALQWDSVFLDEAAPYLTVCRAWHTEHNRPVIMSELKTKAAHRDVPLPDCLTKCLREAKETSTSDYVVANSEGEPLSYTQFKRLWQYIVTRTVKERSYYRYENGKRVKHTVKPVLGERAAHNGKVVYSLDFEVTPHLLRHTYITNLIHASVDPKTVQYLAGHENSKITMDIYAKAKYNRPDELAGILEDTFTLWDAE